MTIMMTGTDTGNTDIHIIIVAHNGLGRGKGPVD